MLNIEDKQGYKYTEEFGYIPEDWEVKNIVKTSNLKARIGWQGLTTAEYLNNGDYLLVTGTDFDNGKINWQSCFYVEKKRYDQDTNIQLKNGDVLITKDGTIGKVAYIDKLPKPTTLNSGVFVVRPLNEAYNTKYFYYLLQSNIFISFLNKLKAGSTIVHLYQKDLSNFDYIIPSDIQEQEKIAEVLGDVDSLIDKTQQLINKKKGLKTATMQKLLTPKEDWVIKTLGELGEITGAGVDKKVCDDEIPVRLVNFLDVYHKDFINSSILNHWVTAKQEKITQCKVKKGDVFFTPSSEMRYDIGMSAVAIEDIENAVYSYHVVRLRLKTEFDLKFSSYIFNTKFFLNQAETICEGSGKRYVITLPKFREMKICYPEDVKIQNKIATILSDMDSEIEALEKELNKYKDLKTGMMQQLLTGKVRLV